MSPGQWSFRDAQEIWDRDGRGAHPRAVKVPEMIPGATRIATAGRRFPSSEGP